GRIAGLAGIQDAVATLVERAVVTARVGVVAVAVVALLARIQVPVAAHRAVGAAGVVVRAGRLSRRLAGLAGGVEEAVAADRQHAVVAAGVGVDAVAVVALLAGIHMAVAAHRAVGPAGVVVRAGRRSRRLAGLTGSVPQDAVAALRQKAGVGAR